MNEALLIVSLTSRALAESAQRFGIAPIVLDAFSDIDTQRVASYSQRIAWSDEGPVNAEQLLNPSEEISGLVYGSGLEHAAELLEPWFQAGKLCGNSPSVIRTVNDPRSFFAMLDNLEIPHPELRFNSPQQNRGWLVKRAGASGGDHVRHWQGEEHFNGRDYFQEYLLGQGISVLFLADGKRTYIVGFNTQWTQQGSFSWGGAINRVALDPEQRMDLVRYVKSLVAKLGLKGMNSLDLVLTEDGPKVLELNPRPSASFELYDEDFDYGLLYWHLQSCHGHLPGALSNRRSKVRARKVCYASQAIAIPANVNWPAWCHDLPSTGTFIAAQEPVCTIAVEGRDQSRVKGDVDARSAQISRLLTSFERPRLT